MKAEFFLWMDRLDVFRIAVYRYRLKHTKDYPEAYKWISCCNTLSTTGKYLLQRFFLQYPRYYYKYLLEKFFLLSHEILLQSIPTVRIFPSFYFSLSWPGYFSILTPRSGKVCSWESSTREDILKQFSWSRNINIFPL